jgi:lipopolysaccharide export system protein LptA
VSAENSKQIRRLHFRAQLPKIFRIAAIAILGLTLIAVGIGYYRAKSTAEFRMVGFPTELSKDVIATVSGYERRETDGETVKYYIKADSATTFSDNHQELQNVYLQLFGEDGSADEITAQKAVYIPEENKNFRGFFAGDVVISSRDRLILRTEQIAYSKANDIATADEEVEFERLNMKGRASGATLELGKRLLQLNRNVQFEVGGENGSYSKLIAANAIYDQAAERVELLEGATIEKRDSSGGRNVDSKLKADRVVAHLFELNGGSRVVENVELYNNVDIQRTDNGSVASMQAANGSYSRSEDRLRVENHVIARFSRGDSVYDAQSNSATYEPVRSRIELNGDAKIQNNENSVAGQSLVAYLDTAYSLKTIDASDNARMHQVSDDYITEISAPKITGVFDETKNLTRADSSGASEIVRTSKASADHTKLTVKAAASIHSRFRGADRIDTLEADGRTTVRFDIPNNGGDSADRSVTADSVRTTFQSDGKNIQRAEAIGNAEFLSSPHNAGPENYSLKSSAPRFDCDFYAGRNDPRSCVASNGTNTIRTPTVQQRGRGVQTISAARLTVSFDERSRAISRLDAAGKSKVAELDRTAIADSFGFSTGDEVIQLRGGEPTAWDSRARIKAKEIDWDTKNGRSAFRRSVSSTYYNSQSVGNASPFGDQGKPFYVTSENAELDHGAEQAMFTGNARGWQGNNYVRGERLEIRKRDSQLNVFGGVQSLLYDVRKTASGASSVPVFAAADEMHYDGNGRTIKYERGVDIRQGPDRMTGASAFIRLNERNEMVQTNVDSNVTVAQSGRKAFAESLVYTGADDRLFLRGHPARIEDNERGSSQGEELEIFLSDNRMSGEGRSKTNPTGRVRNVYKVK